MEPLDLSAIHAQAFTELAIYAAEVPKPSARPDPREPGMRSVEVLLQLERVTAER